MPLLPTTTYKVRILCQTFNHARYIEETMNGFCMQKTDFPFVAIIIDDASTDGEPNVIRNYLENHFDMANARYDENDDAKTTFAIHRTNANCHFLVIYLKYNFHSIKKPKYPLYKGWHETVPYMAMCEGDDYWIHPQKLQMQVDFLERHPDYVLCHTDFELSTGGYRNHNYKHTDNDNVFLQTLTKGISIGTLTVVYRADVYKHIPQLWVGKGWPSTDYAMWIEMSHEGKFKRLSEITAKYRILAESFSHGDFDKEVRFMEAQREIRLFYSRHYGISLPNEGLSIGYYVYIMKTAFKHHRKDAAKKYLAEAKENKMVSRKLLIFYYATVITPLGWILRKKLNR